jgi:hypothetical protein
MRHCTDISDKKDENTGCRRILLKHDLGENGSFYYKLLLESLCHDIYRFQLMLMLQVRPLKSILKGKGENTVLLAAYPLDFFTV